jgi:cytochrome b6-f complex iron-sulfur subunit
LARVVGLVSRFQHGQTVEGRRVGRRSFIRNAALGAVLIVLAQIGAGFVRFFWPNKTGAFGGNITVPASVIPEVNGEPYRNVDGKFYLVHTEDGLMALWWRCVHLGCTVPWISGQHHFACPCHGSVYEYNGNRISGPAPRPLDYFTLSVSGSGEVIVDTGAPNKRGAYDPSQATPYQA